MSQIHNYEIMLSFKPPVFNVQHTWTQMFTGFSPK